MYSPKPLAVLLSLLLTIFAYAQSPNVKALVVDESNGEALSFATVSLSREGQAKPYKYNLTNEEGKLAVESVRKGKYELKVELLGYQTYTKHIEVDAKDVDLGTIKMKLDAQQLEQATVSAYGSQVQIKKDTIEYNATTFRTTDNDVLEDLLKKLPGVEIGDDGAITVNGETIKKITIDGKTFFLDDPQMASKNIPAKLVNKLKVIKKKSEQAEFTGIDDGNEENVIDLSIKPGMMKGLMGNLTAGAGRDVPSANNTNEDWRFLGNAFVGRFDDKTQVSLILNGNNNNNQGSTDRSGEMMRGMRGGRGGQYGGSRAGITTSYLAGANFASNFFDDAMEFGGNYNFNSNENVRSSHNLKTTFRPGDDLIYDSRSQNTTFSLGHSFGMRINHKFSDNTSIIFQPQLNFGTGSYSEDSRDTTYTAQMLPGNYLSKAFTRNTGDNKNLSAGGFFLFRQRLGIPGRTITAMINANFSNNQLDGYNNNGTDVLDDAGNWVLEKSVNQSFDNNQHSTSLMGNLTYTEPLGDSFYIEANYQYNYRRSSSDKRTYDLDNEGVLDYDYSNHILNDHRSQRMGFNALYQKETLRAQLGFSAIPTATYNRTTRGNQPQEYKDFNWRFSPQAMFYSEFDEMRSLRFFYFGNSNQPSTSQLMPVPDNSDPLNISFGNPSLKPYFSHSMRGNYRYNNRESFSSVNLRFNAEYVDNSIVNVAWYGANGGEFSLPINGPATANFGLNMFANLPIAKSKFSIVNMFGSSYRKSSTFLAQNIDMSLYEDQGFYAFMNQFVDNLADNQWYGEHIMENITRTINLNEHLRLTYRNEAFDVSVGARTRMNLSRYSLTEQKEKTTTWNNRVSANFTWNWESTGISMKSDFNYNWYRGYSTQQPSEAVLNAEISKNVLKNAMTIAIRGYDILAQASNITVTDSANYHSESTNNTLGRYIILSVSWRFGNMGGQRQGGRGMGPGMGRGMSISGHRH